MASEPFRWRAGYISKEERILTFFSKEELDRAMGLCWKDSDFFAMPRRYIGGFRVVVPADAVDLFQSRGFIFQVSEFLFGGDYREARHARLREKENRLSIDDFITKYWTEKPRRINFSEKHGVLCFTYEERVLDLKEEYRERWKIYRTEGEIPLDIKVSGEDAIRMYAEEKITAYLLGAREREVQHEAYASNLNFPVEFKYGEVFLKGVIVAALDSTLIVRLQEPYQGERPVHYGFGAAMAGKRIFDEQDRLTEDAIDSARRWMIYIYEEQFEYEQNLR